MKRTRTATIEREGTEGTVSTTTTKKFRSRNTGTTIGKTLGFPKLMKFKHRYCQLANLTDSGAVGSVAYSCNGMFQPPAAGGGHQPMYFDQVGAIYDHYCVVGSQITWTIVPGGTAVQNPYRIITWINDDTTTIGTVDALSENTFAQVRLCAGGVNPDKIILHQNWSAKKFFGGSVLANDELKGTISANPVEQSWFQIAFRTLDGSSTVSVYVQAEITYTAIWKELKELVIS